MKSNTRQRRPHPWVAGLFISAACVGPAQAQQVGRYIGETADGHQVKVDVALDAKTGTYYIASIGSGFTLVCRKTGHTQEWVLASYGHDTPVDDGHADFLLRRADIYLESSLDFQNDNRITGKIRAGLPRFADKLSPPKATEACNADNQKFSAELTSAETPDVPLSAPHRATVRMGRDGRVELTTVR